MKKLKSSLALFLVLSMMLSVFPIGALAVEDTASAADEEIVLDESFTMPDQAALTGADREIEAVLDNQEGFMKVFHLDVGRKYFTVDEVKEVIDAISNVGYSHLELAVGNDGLRFLLDDMSVTVGDTTYDGNKVAAGVKAGNKEYSHEGEWSQSEMDVIIAYAASKGVEIIPLINNPGHMDAILAAMENVGIDGSYNGSVRTVSVLNDAAVDFTQALVAKYVEYFAGKGCAYFNMGADEYANDIYDTGSMGFGHLISVKRYGEFITYVNEVSAIIEDAGMTPIAFNDGIYYQSNTDYGTFDTDIVVAYWSAGWSGHSPAPSAFLEGKGHKILNTNERWYYVLGRTSGTYGYEGALSGAGSVDLTVTVDNGNVTPVGAMQCVWCDVPSVDYSSYKENVMTLIQTMADNNPDYFTGPNVQNKTVISNGIAVTAPELTKATITKLEQSSTYKDYTVSVAYDVTLEVNNGEPYTGAATLEVPLDPVFAGCNDFVGIVDGENGRSRFDVTLRNGYLVAEVPHFSTVTFSGRTVIYEETVNMYVGDTPVKVKIPDVSYTDADKVTTELDTSIADVTVGTYNQAGGTVMTPVTSVTAGSSYYIQNSSGQYLTSSGDWTSDVDSAAQWKVTERYSGYPDYGYRLTNGSNYIRYGYNGWSVSASTTGATLYFKNGVFTHDSGGDLGAPVIKGTSAPESGTLLTFTAAGVGTTYVTVGNTRYTINVLPEALKDATDLQVSWWITNIPVTSTDSNVSPDGTFTDGDKTINYTAVSALEAYGENGILLSSVVPATGKWDYGNLVFWKGTKLTDENRQTSDGGADSTAKGIDFARVRYYENGWEICTDASVTKDSVWVSVGDTDQVVAYYLQEVVIEEEALVKEFAVLVKDWGYLPGGYNDKNTQLGLTFAVVYPDGKLSAVIPGFEDLAMTDVKAYPENTMLFNYNDAPRNIGVIAPVNNLQNEISKITITNGTREETGTWGVDDTIVWETKTDEENPDVKWFKEYEVWNNEMATAPTVSGTDPEKYYYWQETNTAKLILIYLEPVHYDENLIVQWVDDSNGGSLIHEMEVGVTSETDDELTFQDCLNQNSDVPVLGDTSSFTLDENAYVTNSSDQPQTFNQNVATIPGVAPQYRSGLYEHVSTNLSADGKTLILHYNINTQKLSPLYVVDFGLPVTFKVTDLILNEQDVTSVTVEDGNFGTAVLNDNNTAEDISDDTVTYTPTSILMNADALKVTVSFNNGTRNIFRMGFMPAPTIYYEEGFAFGDDDTTPDSDNNNVVPWTGSIGSKGGANIGVQQTQIAAKDGKNTTTDVTYFNYGYDVAYDDETAASVTSAVSTDAGDRVDFDFAGTGIDIYANCDTTTGVAAILLTNDDNQLVKFYQVDTRMVNGDAAGTQGQAVAANNLPIVSVQGLPYDTYTVTIQHIKRGADGTAGGDIRLDGFRIYDTMNDLDNGFYVKKEQNPTYVEVRDHVLAALGVNTSSTSEYKPDDEIITQVYDSLNASGVAADAGIYFITTDEGTKEEEIIATTDKAAVQDLLDNGPKNELFLQPGQAVAFSLANGVRAQIGMKAVNGSVNAIVNDDNRTLTACTDMFYNDVTGEVVIKNSSDSKNILSITLLKVTDGNGGVVSTVFNPATRNFVAFAVMRAAGPEPEVKVYADAELEVTLGRKNGRKVKEMAEFTMTENGVEGETATFTAEEILAAVADELPKGYAVADEEEVEDVEVVYGEDGSVTILLEKAKAQKPEKNHGKGNRR